MTPGSILSDDAFLLSDGSTKQKFLVLLNDGECGWYVAVTTTSRGERYSHTTGCHVSHYSSFHLPEGCCWLDRDSWVQLHEFHEFTAAEFLGAGNRFRVCADLSRVLRVELVQCALKSRDLSRRHRVAILLFAN